MEETPTEFAARMAVEHGSKNRELNKQMGFFPTPDEGARLLLRGGRLDLSNMADIGAGFGILTAAAVESAIRRRIRYTMHCTLYENQTSMIPHLKKVMKYTQDWAKKRGLIFRYSIVQKDLMDVFLDEEEEHNYTTIVSNPPFVRVLAESKLWEQAQQYRCTVNLYGAFMEGALKWTTDGGHLLLIAPTSWKNGKLFTKLRKHFLPEVKLEHIVSFTRRDNVFKGVLQEVEFTRWKKGGRVTKNSVVKITLASRLSSVEPYQEFKMLHSTMVPNRTNGLILTPDHPDYLKLIHSINGKLSHSSSDLGLRIRIGEVVMHREEEGVVNSSKKRRGDVPLIREHHITPSGLVFPRKTGLEQWVNARCPRIKILREIVVLSRRGAKGDRRRLKACYIPEHHGGIENKVVYLTHREKNRKLLMKGVSAFTNSMFADIQIRSIAGGTMVNKSDFERLRFPSPENLISIGRRMHDNPTDARELETLISTHLQLSEEESASWLQHFSEWRKSR